MKDLNNTAMNQTDSVKRDMAYGQLAMLVTTPDDDMKANTDYFIGKLRVAYRRRRISIAQYNEISIRFKRESGAETEMSKILAGKAKARLYIFEFVDCWVFATATDILTCLRDPQLHYAQPNNDGLTHACYIKLKDLPNHLIIWRDRAKNVNRCG